MERPGSASYFMKKLKLLEADDATSDLTKSIAQFDKNRNFSLAQLFHSVREDLPKALQVEKEHLAHKEFNFSVASAGSSSQVGTVTHDGAASRDDSLGFFSEAVKQRYSRNEEAESGCLHNAQVGVAPLRSVMRETRSVRPALRPLSASAVPRNVEMHTTKLLVELNEGIPTQKSSSIVRPASAFLKRAQKQLDALLREEGRLAIEAKQRASNDIATAAEPNLDPSEFLRKLRNEIKTEELMFGKALDAEVTDIADDEESFDALEIFPPSNAIAAPRPNKLSPIGRPPIGPLCMRESASSSLNEPKERSVSPAFCCSPETTRHPHLCTGEAMDSAAPSTRPSSAFIAVQPPSAAVLLDSCCKAENGGPQAEPALPTETNTGEEQTCHPSACTYAEKFRRKLFDLEQPRPAAPRGAIMRDIEKKNDEKLLLDSQRSCEEHVVDSLLNAKPINSAATAMTAVSAKWSDVFACSDPSDMIRVVMDDILYASPFLTSPATKVGEAPSEELDSPLLMVKRTQQEDCVAESDDEWDGNQQSPAQRLDGMIDVSTPPPMRGWALSLNSPSHSFASNGAATATAPPQLDYSLPQAFQETAPPNGDDFVACHFFSLKSLEKELIETQRKIRSE